MEGTAKMWSISIHETWEKNKRKGIFGWKLSSSDSWYCFYPYDSKMAFLYEMHIYSAEDGIHLM